MKQFLDIDVNDSVVLLASEIVYSQKKQWCEAKYRQLKCSLMKPRTHFSYDKRVRYPLIIFLCGGSFAEVDRNVWMPELEYFVKRGWAVMSVDYSTTQLTKWSEQLEDVKSAIRYARAHADEFCIDAEKVVVMGESAGGYLSLLSGFTNDNKEYDVGENLSCDSSVSAIVALYPVTNIKNSLEKIYLPPFTKEYPNLCDIIPTDIPPTLILHGTDDSQVSYRDSEELYKTMQRKGLDVTLYLLKGANHADHHFVQEPVKEIVYNFISNK